MKTEHVVVYAYDYQAHIGYFDTAEEAKRKVSSMMSQIQVWKIQFCEYVCATSDDIGKLQKEVQNALDLLKILQKRGEV